MNIVDRVEKLIALANRNNSEEEARTAAREAARLIGKHGLKIVEPLAQSVGTTQTAWRSPSATRERWAEAQRQASERASTERARKQREAEQQRKDSANARHHGGPADLKFSRVRSTRQLICARCNRPIRVGDTIAWPGGYHFEHAMHERCYGGAYEEQG